MNVQEIMLNKREIILTDHKTKINFHNYFDFDGVQHSESLISKKERFFQVIDKLNVKNLNKGISKFNSGMNEFNKVVAAPKARKSIGHDYRGGTDIVDALGTVKHVNLMGKSKSANIWGSTSRAKTTKRRTSKKDEPVGLAFWGKSKGGVW